MPIESFVKTFFADWLNWTFFWWLEPCLLCRSTQLRATTSCRSQSATTCDSSYVLQNTTPYWKSATPVLPCTTLYYKVYSVLQSATPVLLCTTQHYSVVQTTTPVLLCTTKYYSVLLQYYSVLQSIDPVLQSAAPVLLYAAKYYSSTILYYEVLLQHYSVLQSTTPVLLCTTKYYSSTSLYYKVLLQYYSVLQSTTPVLVSTTKYYSSTTLYYKVLLQYSVLQSTTPVLLCTTKYYSSTTLYYKVLLQCYSVLQTTTPVLLWTTKYYSSTTKYYSSTTPVLLCTTKYYSSTTLMIDPRHIWNVIYNARHNRCHPPTSPNTAPATQNDCHYCSSSHMKRYLQCAEQQMASSNIIEYCACHAKWLSWLILVTYETLFTMRRATLVIAQTHQILRLPRKMTVMTDPRHIWNVIYNAQSNKCHCPNSPNTAPATKNDRPKSQRNLLKTAETSFPMRGRSDHDPTMIREWNRPSATRLATEVTFHAHHEQFVLKNTTFRAPAIIPNFTEYCACHEKWHLNFTKHCACHEKWHLNFTKYCACHEK